jgi:hypothetical protein
MPATAPYRTSLRQNAPKAQAQPTEISDAAKRCSARMEVVRDTRLSAGACRLYFLLDDYAGWKGSAWPSQAVMARDIGIGERQVNRQLDELETAGHITRTRGQNCAIIRLSWMGSQVTEMSVPENPQLTSEAVASDKNVSCLIPCEPEHEPEGECPHCEGTGERVYSIPAGRDSLGRRTAERRWRGPCGCGILSQPTLPAPILGEVRGPAAGRGEAGRAYA